MLPTRAAACTSLLLLAAALLAFPQSGSAQVPQRTPKRAAGTAAYPPAPSRLRLARQFRMRSFTAAPRASAVPTATVTESEPNDTTTQANLVTLGDTATGTIDPSGDVDFYAVDVPAATIIALDVIAEQAGSQLDATLTLVGPDSTSVLAFNDDFYGRDSHFEYTVSTAGRYFVLLESYDGSGGPGFTYWLAFGAVTPGPGDFTTLYTTNLGSPYGIAAGPTGELYVTDVDSLRLLRVAPDGQVTVLAQFQEEFPVGVVVDGLGDVLVSTVDTSFLSGKIVRLSGGQRSTFAAGLTAGGAITIGPDGDVWVIDPANAVLHRYDPYGAPKSPVDLSSLSYLDFDMGLAFSPAGDLYLSNAFDAIYKIVSGVPQLVYQTYPVVEGLAFDKDGYLYVANGFFGRVILLNPSLQVVNDPFARSYISGPTQLAFPRDAAGAMTSRLLAENVGFFFTPPYAGGIVEMNPAAMRAVGFRIGIDLLRIANAAVKNGVIGTDYADTLRLVAAPGPATWSVVSGALPPGLALSGDGRIIGIPEQAGAFTFGVRVDAASQFGSRSFTVTVTSPTVAIDAASQHLLGGAQLDLTLQRFLDLQGNKNGRFDVGDFRAFLRAAGQLPAAAVARTEAP
jgi:Bacterial pre-peptidase C-terminal domain